MRAIAYAVPILLSVGIIVAGVASWRALAGKAAVALGVLALVCSALTLYQAEQAIDQFQRAVDGLNILRGPD